MPTISDIQKEYFKKLDQLDLELLIAHTLQKSREFVLSHPEYEIPEFKIKNLKLKIARRASGEPLSYITGRKEFFGLDFKVDKHTLIPRPETEILVEEALEFIKTQKHKNIKTVVADIGTGSGCIIISISKYACHPELASGSLEIPDSARGRTRQVRNDNVEFYATDISKKALTVAKQNSKTHNVDKQITFLHGNLLEPIIEKKELFIDHCSLIIVSNLPYLSKEVFENSPIDVKNFEPKSALYSDNAGLAHYEELFQQVNVISESYKLKTISCILEFSPEQKIPLEKMIANNFPSAKTKFLRDLAGKWRVAKISL